MRERTAPYSEWKRKEVDATGTGGKALFSPFAFRKLRFFVECRMMRGIRKCFWIVFAGCAGAGISGAEVLRFEDFEAVWEGGLADGEMVASGRLAGIAEPFRISQRMRRAGDDWGLEGEISLPDSRVDFGAVSAAIPGGADWGGEGEVGLRARFSGKPGEWEASGTISLRGARLENAEMGLTVSGIGGELAWEFGDGGFSTPPGQVLTFSRIAVEGMEAGPGELAFRLVSLEELRVELAVLHWAGGRLSAGDFAFRPGRPDFSVRLFAAGIQLAELLAMTPELGAKGTGVIDGELEIGIRPGGVRLEDGALLLRSEEAARLELPQRAWFTGGMVPGRGNYENLRLVERALEDLELERFRLAFLGGEEGEPDLRLEIGGRPGAPDLPETPVSVTLNVFGPVREIGNWFLGGGKVGR